MQKQILKYRFKKLLIHECEVIDLREFLANNKKILFLPHRTNFYHFFYFKKASGVYTIDFSPVELCDNSLLFVGKDSVHQLDTDTEAEGKVLFVTNDFFCRHPQDFTFLQRLTINSRITKNCVIRISAQDTVFDTIFQQISEELQKESDSFQSPILHSFVRSILLLLQREQSHAIDTEKHTHSTDLELIATFLELLENHYVAQHQVEYYSKTLNVTLKRLQKATLATFDTTPKQIIKDRIVLEAKRQLVHSSESIKEIAYRLGFEETTNFTKFFKKEEQKTPLEFRSQHQG